MNCFAIPIRGDVIKFQGIGLNCNLKATIDNIIVKTEFNDKELLVYIPKASFEKIGKEVHLKLTLNDGRTIKIPKQIVYCDN